MTRCQILHGCLLGTALGDALGLPFERLSLKKRQRIFGDLKNGLQMCLLPGRGMLSDDTEHALFTVRALLESRGDTARFGRSLRGELRRWMLYLPPGVGLATLRAGLKAVCFLPNTGVFSAGNGPAMRAPILGAFFVDSTRQLREFCRVSTLLTHTDPQAEWGAFAIALASAESVQGRADGRRFVRELTEWSDDSPAAREMLDLAKKAVNSASRGQTTAEFVQELGSKDGISGYIFHTVPAVLQCWLRHCREGEPNFRAALEETILCGGDTDTTAAILGGILGARLGPENLPADWKSELWDFPNTPAYIERLAREMTEAHEAGLAVVAPRVVLGTPLLRNVFFVLVILTHALRRALPF